MRKVVLSIAHSFQFRQLPSRAMGVKQPRPPRKRVFGQMATLSTALLGIGTLFPRRQILADSLDVSPPTDNQHTDLHIRNLVFKGGGAKGIAYGPALVALEKSLGSLNGIERTAGTSAGAIIATLLSVGYTPKEIHHLLIKMQTMNLVFLTDQSAHDSIKQWTADMLDIAGNEKSKPIKALNALFTCLIQPMATIKIIKLVITKKGICSGDAFREWFDDTIARKIAMNKHQSEERYKEYKYLTFGQLRALKVATKPNNTINQYKDLYIVCAMYHTESEQNDLDDGQGFEKIVFSTEESDKEHYVISDTVRVSMSIPGIFQSTGLYYLDQYHQRQLDANKSRSNVDGGILHNYPVELFDENHYLDQPFYDKSPTIKHINPETIGFKLEQKKPVKRFFQKVWATLSAPQQHQTSNLVDNADQYRHIIIDTHGLGLLDFNLASPSIDALEESGAKATIDYFHTTALKLKIIQNNERNKSKRIERLLLKNYRKHTNIIKGAPVSPDFILREEMHQINESLEINKAKFNGTHELWITGFSGTGKSQLAYKTAHTYLNKHFIRTWREGRLGTTTENMIWPVIWIIDAESSDSIYDAYTQLAKNLLLHNKNLEMELHQPIVDKIYNDQVILKSSERKHLLEFIKLQLADNPHWMLIFDGGNQTRQALEPFFFKSFSQRGAILVANQNQPTNTLGYDLVLNLNRGLSPQDAKQFFQDSSFKDRTGDLDQLIKALHCLPLSLSVASSYLRQSEHHNMSYDDYLYLFQKVHHDITKGGKVHCEDFKDQIHCIQQAALTLSITSIYNTDSIAAKDAKLIMYCSALLPNHQVNAHLLKILLKIHYSKIELTDTQINMKLTRAKYLIGSLITGQGDRMHIHQLVQKTIQGIHCTKLSIQDCQSVDSSIIATMILIAAIFDDPHQVAYNSFAFSASVESVSSHYNKVYSNKIIPNNIKLVYLLADLYNKYGVVSYRQYRYKKSEKAYMQALQIFTSNNLDGCIRAIQIKNNLANVYSDTGRIKEATVLYKQVLQEYKRHGKGNNIHIMRTKDNLASLYRDNEKYQQAEYLYLEIIDYYLKNDLMQSTDAASCKTNLASLYSKTGRYIMAQQLYRDALEILAKLNLNNSIDAALAKNALGSLYSHTGRFDQAKELHKQALIIYANHGLGDSVRVAMVLFNLAGLYSQTGNDHLAQSTYQSALRIYTRNNLSDMIEAAETKNNLANLYLKEGRYRQAEKLLLQVLNTYYKYNLGDSIKFADAKHNLALTYYLRGLYHQAESLFLQELTTYDKYGLSDDSKVTDTKCDLAFIYSNTGRQKQAEVLLLHVLDSYDRHDLIDSPKALSARVKLSTIYGETGRHHLSENLFLNLLEIYERKGLAYSYKAANAKCNLGKIYTLTGKYDQARNIYNEALGIFWEQQNFNSALITLTTMCSDFSHSKREDYSKESCHAMQQLKGLMLKKDSKPEETLSNTSNTSQKVYSPLEPTMKLSKYRSGVFATPKKLEGAYNCPDQPSNAPTEANYTL